MQGGQHQSPVDRIYHNLRSSEKYPSAELEPVGAKLQVVGRGGQQRTSSQQPLLELVSSWDDTQKEVGTTGQPPRQRTSWLAQALGELDEIKDEVAEEGLPDISRGVMEEARRILRDLRSVPIAPMIYSTEDGEISIDFRSSTSEAQAVLIELGDDGGGACFAFIDGKGRRARYSDSSDLPDEFARAQLSALAKPA